MTDFMLARARLRDALPLAAIRKLLLPDEDAARANAAHRLLWSLFADDPDRRRDFLWREADRGVFYLLSSRAPTDPHQMFEIDPPKPFAPVLSAGDRLRFSLRANATVSRGSVKGERGKPMDVVMDAIYRVPKAERAAVRPTLIIDAGRAWLTRQGERCGFAFEDGDECKVLGYRVLRLPHGKTPMQLGVLEFEGQLTVRDPVRFVEALTHGIGRGKAFGNGLMLIRRA